MMTDIRKQDPLKQGLKQKLNKILVFDLKNIRKQDPLKQGLKQEYTIRYDWEAFEFVSKIH